MQAGITAKILTIVLLSGVWLNRVVALTPPAPAEPPQTDQTTNLRQHIQDSLQLQYEEKFLAQMDSLEQLFAKQKQIFLNKYNTERALYSEKIESLIDSIKTLNEKLVQTDKATDPTDSLFEARYFGYLDQLKTARKQKSRLFWKIKLATEAVLPFQLQELKQYQQLFFPGAHCDYGQDYITQLHIRHGNWAAAELSLLKFMYLYPHSPIYDQVKKIRTGIIHTERYYRDHRKALLKALGNASQNPVLSRRYFELLRCLYHFPHPPVAEKFISEAECYLQHFPQSIDAPQINFWIAERYARQGAAHKAFLKYEKLKSLYPACDQYPQALYRQIEIQVAQFGQYQAAIGLSDQFLEKFPQDSLAAAVMLEKARIYDQDLHNWTKAIPAYQNFADTYPQADQAVASLMRKAQLLAEEMSLIEQSVAVYREIEKRYAGTAAARKALLAAGDLLARQGNFQAAVAQYSDLIDRYPQSAAALQALEQSAQIYQKELHNTAEAIRMWERIVDNFPDSKSASKARKALDKANPDEAEKD